MKLNHKELEQIGFPYILEHIPVLSPLGEEKKRGIQPLSTLQEVEEELSLVDWAVEKSKHPVMNALQQELMLLKDVGGSLQALPLREMTLPELFALKGFVLRLRGVALALGEMSPVPEAIAVDPCPEVLDILDPDHTLTPAFALREGWSNVLAQIRAEKRELEKQIALAKGEEREALLVERTGVCAREEVEEGRMRRELTLRLRPYADRLKVQRQKLGRLDLVLGKAAMARELNAVRPELGASSVVIQNMRLPELEARLKEQGHRFTPLTMELVTGVCALTGANMGGKSVALKTLALCVYMAHCGLYVCAEAAQMPFFGGLCLIGGDMEDAGRGLSSFGGELMAVQQAAETAENDMSLCLFDEFGRGTNPFEGARIQRGVAAYFKKLGAYSVFVTHYDGVSELAEVCYRTRGLHDLPEELATENPRDRLSRLSGYMDYGLERVERDAPVPREALHVAELLGLSQPLLEQIRQEYR